MFDTTQADGVPVAASPDCDAYSEPANQQKVKAVSKRARAVKFKPPHRPCRSDGTDCTRLIFDDPLGKLYVTYRDHETVAMNARIAEMCQDGAVLVSAERGKYVD
jgi:hypothetical protein